VSSWSETKHCVSLHWSVTLQLDVAVVRVAGDPVRVSERLVLPDVGPEVWDDFQAGGAPLIAKDLLSCWQRAQHLGAPRLGARPEDQLLRGDALRLHAEHVELVQAIGDIVLDRATAHVADRDFLLLLADADGVVVSTRGGGGFAETAQRLRLIEGAAWSERARGTNAIGTAATANRAVEVHGHAHFGQSYSDLVCYAAPIRGVDGAPIAVLDATSSLAHADASVGRVITRAARALADLLRLQAYAAAGVSVARLLGRSVERMRDPAILVESPGRIVRANAGFAEVAGRSVDEALGIPWQALVVEALNPTGREVELRGRRFRLHVEPLAAPNGVVLAMLVVFEPQRHVTKPPPEDPFAPIFTEDAAVRAAIAWSKTLAPSELPVMLLAETGAGKELFARAIHATSGRGGQLLAVNCGALAPSLLETELFGYAPGAFTGAERTGRAGLFAAARGGTLFLDEVAEMSPAMQSTLLRVLETGTFRRVGDTRLERCDVRVICATCRDLPALVAAGTFRQDLYYRLKGATVTIPPLRERTDVLALAHHLLDGKIELAPAAAAAIAAHPWPGNVRELKSTLAVAKLGAGAASWIELAHLPPDFSTAPAAPRGELDVAERDALRRVLAECHGNLSEAARKLGVARSTLYRMLRKHALTAS
jgi:sigma-54 dependent transcriptional regulator, acetoin dehydrogenase operon transcriptional activator AcoR